MLGPILSAIANQIGPVLNNLMQNVAPLLNRIPRGVYIVGARILSKEIDRHVSNWYNSLSSKAQERIDKAIFWVIKDLTGDVISSMTGIPLKPLVDKVFDQLKEYRGDKGAKEYVETELKKQIEILRKIAPSENFLYKPIVDKAKCVGCGECVDVCPVEVFEMVDEKSAPINAEECLGCETCVEVCEANAISIEEIEI